MKRIAIIVVIAQLSLGCLRAEQSRGPAPATASSPVQETAVQQLSEILDPLQIKVTAASLSPAPGVGTQELRVQWISGSASSAPDTPKAGPPPQGAFRLAQQRKYPDAPPRQRSLDLGPGRVLVGGIDGKGQLRSWSVMLDPRIIRSEGPGPDGVLTGQLLHMEQAEFFVSFPDDPEIVEVRVYEAQSNARPYKLVQVGRIALTR